MAEVTILVEGYYSKDANGQERTCPTITLVKDRDIVMVVDPGILEDQQILVDALKKEGLEVQDINVVCITHSHIDHYKNVGMFKNARVLEYRGVWQGNTMQDWQENFSDNIQIVRTPGHDYSSITLFVTTNEGIIAICGDVFWKKEYPATDPYASDLQQLQHSRDLVLKMAHWVIPGHAGMFTTGNGHNLPEIKNNNKAADPAMGNCKKCHRPFLKASDKCMCQEWLCFRCCECEADCERCNCKVRRGG